MNIKSMSHCTKNENGFEELELVYEKTILDAILRREGKIIKAEYRSNRWCYFGTVQHVSYEDEKEISIIIETYLRVSKTRRKSLVTFKKG